MKRPLNKRERIGSIVLLVGLIALAVDRLLLPPPTAADAAPTRPVRVGVSAPVVPTAPASAPSALAPLLDIADIFAWSRLGSARESIEPGAAGVDENAVRAGEFTRAHSLKATVLGPRPLALIGNRVMHPGEVLDGFTLEAIRGNEAVFVWGGQRVTLRIRTVGKKD